LESKEKETIIFLPISIIERISFPQKNPSIFNFKFLLFKLEEIIKKKEPLKILELVIKKICSKTI
jgi:hypothetical protein